MLFINWNELVGPLLSPQPLDPKTLMEHLDLILEHQDTILDCEEYFFVPVTPSKPLGYLIRGWQDGVLKEPGGCEHCGGEVLVIACAGSPLSGTQWWKGVCRQCKTVQSRHAGKYGARFKFLRDMNRDYPAWCRVRESYDGFTFTWGGSGLEPTRKERLAWKRTVEPVTFEELIAALKQL